MLDIKEPGDDFSAGIFHDLAWEAVDQIVKVGAFLVALEHCIWHLMPGVIMKQGGGIRLKIATAIRPSRQDGKTPILVGGTGLYLDWFVRGKPGTPVSTRETAAAAQRRLQEVG